MDNQFAWVVFYKEFASKLLEYKNKRNQLIELVERIYTETGINLPTLELDNKLVDIDPFTVFGLFNKSSMREENRIKIIAAVKNIFAVETEVPTLFDSIPLLNNQNAIFYSFLDSREDEDIDDLWELFESALKYAKDPTVDNREGLSKFFDAVINKKGNGNSKITTGLYWIAPDCFLNLDSRNEWYIYKSGKIPADIVETLPAIEIKIPAEKYFAIIEKLRVFLQSEKSDLKDFKELSYAAWTYSTQVNEEQRAKKQEERIQKGNGLADADVDETHYWIYSPGDGASKWEEFCERGVMGLGWSEIGDLTQYSSKDEMKAAMKETIDPSKSHKNGAHATWQFLKDMKVGDVVFAKRGMHTVIGRGVVTSDYIYDTTDPEYPNIRKVNWTSKKECEHPGQAVMKTLTDITAYTDYVEKLNALYDDSDDIESAELEERTFPTYSPERFLEEVYMDSDSYDTLVELLRMKKNVILQGAPGVGKTYAAKRLAYSMMGCKDQDRVMMVQFHQSYTYEDFIEGFRPSSSKDSGFEIKKGSFYNFCKKAADDLDKEYFFIIDEINRGNLSKIFGELFMLIENDKRGNALQLLYSDEKFFVPANVYIIGMMNTADRSLAMLDYALRRRFAFFEMKPAFENERFRTYRMDLDSAKFNRLIDCVEKLNSVIASDDSLGDGFCIGHSYFCNLTEVTDKVLSNIVEYEMVPLLKEYWFDEPSKVRDWTDMLRSSIK
jgi:5-methylcytosine-specific restriction enzyme B